MPDTRRSQSALISNFPDNTQGQILPSHVRDLTVSTHPEQLVQTGTTASLPSSGQLTGDLYVPSDGVVAYRYSGSAWAPWGPIFPLADPTLQTFAWINQGGASVSTTNGGIYLSAPANSGDSWRVRKKSAPSTPYTVTVGLLPLVRSGSVGFCWRQSSDGKLVGVGFTQTQFLSYKMNSPTSYAGATYFALNMYEVSSCWGGGVQWLQLGDDGANRTVSVSVDGVHFLQLHSVGRTDFLTADEIGFYGNNYGNDYAASMTLLSWKEA
jgi:hypothetical protein